MYNQTDNDELHYFSVAAMEDSSVCFIEMEVFKNIIRKNIDFAEAFMKDLSRTLKELAEDNLIVLSSCYHHQ